MGVAVEIAVQDLAGLEVAARAGADRVELCADLARGGVTPPVRLVEQAVARARALAATGDAAAHFDVHVLIRCRAGDGGMLERPGEFVYDPAEVSTMAEQAAGAIRAGAAGVVLGALTPRGALDIAALEEIRDAALRAGRDALRGVVLTAHRAVDALPGTAARVHAVQTLLGLGVHRVLSSGGAARALAGVEDLAAMVEAAEDLLTVCAGGGIRPADIDQLVHRTGVTDVHLGARRRPGAPREAGAPETDTDPAIVAAAVEAGGAL